MRTEDEKLRDALAKDLAPRKQQGIVDEWHDRCIVRAGAARKRTA